MRLFIPTHLAARLLFAALGLVLAAPCAGLAQERIDPPELAIVGRAVVRDIEVRVVCEGFGDEQNAVQCRVTTRAELEAEGDGVRLCPGSCGAPVFYRQHVVVDGELLRGERTLSRGERVQVATEVQVPLSVERGLEGLLTQPALGVRHPALGESWLSHHSSRTVRIRPFGGAQLEARGPARVELSAPPRVRARTTTPGVPQVEVQLRPPHGGPPSGPLAHGGPVVTLGGRMPLADGVGINFLLGVGYELGLFEHLIVSAWFETDFDSISEAIVIEAAAPGLIIIVPSLSAGVGVVARQLGVQSADAGLRLRLGASFYFAGFVADFDYWAVAGTWSGTFSARISL